MANKFPAVATWNIGSEQQAQRIPILNEDDIRNKGAENLQITYFDSPGFMNEAKQCITENSLGTNTVESKLGVWMVWLQGEAPDVFSELYEYCEEQGIKCDMERLTCTFAIHDFLAQLETAVRNAFAEERKLTNHELEVFNELFLEAFPNVDLLNAAEAIQNHMNTTYLELAGIENPFNEYETAQELSKEANYIATEVTREPIDLDNLLDRL